MRSFGFVGGDKRSIELLKLLEHKRYCVNYFAMCEAIEQSCYLKKMENIEELFLSSDWIIFGIPMFRNKGLNANQKLLDCDIDKIGSLVRAGQVVCGGQIPIDLKNIIYKNKGMILDFMEEESYAIFNAISVAEGVIFETMKQSKRNIHQSKCLVLGFGRCGKIIADKLKGLSAEVTVCSASSKELAQAKALGFKILCLDALNGMISQYKNIYNTIPKVIIEKNMLSHLDDSSLVIDIVSGEGGVDYEFAKEKKVNCRQLLGIPGKYAPSSVAEKMLEMIINHNMEGV